FLTLLCHLFASICKSAAFLTLHLRRRGEGLYQSIALWKGCSEPPLNQKSLFGHFPEHVPWPVRFLRPACPGFCKKPPLHACKSVPNHRGIHNRKNESDRLPPSQQAHNNHRFLEQWP